MELRPRTLTLNKESVVVHEATDLLAVHIGTGARGKQAGVQSKGEPDAVRHLPLAYVHKLLPGAEVSELKHFEKAGWVFVERSALPKLPESTTGNLLTARVLVDSSGRVSLAPPRVTVKFKDATVTDPTQFFPVGVVHVTTLKFSKGLFSVAFDPAAGMDSLDVAGKLVSTGKVEYAEPELLTYTDHR
jgi:hypothetical protein